MSQDPFVEPEEKPATEPYETAEKIFKTIGDALKGGSEQARKKAEEAAPTIKSAFAKAAYALSYGAAYGGSFGLTLVKELVPEPFKDGGVAGVIAGKEAAQRAMTPSEKKRGSKPDVIIDADYSVR